MKRIAIYSLILTLLLLIFGFPQSHEVLAENDLFNISTTDISKDKTEITLTLNQGLKYGYKMIVKIPKEFELNNDSSKVKANVEYEEVVLFKKGDSLKFEVSHEELSSGYWKGQLPIYYKFQAYIQSKTVYSSTTVSGWDYDNVLLSPPGGDYITKTQYGYKEVTSFDRGNYTLDVPSGPYEAITQYSYKSREMVTTYTKEQHTRDKFYNNIGACPADCHEGTANFYGTGCECTVTEVYYVTIPHTTFGEWTDSDEWRFDEPYVESETCMPISRTVYLLPASISGEGGWRDSPYEASGNIIPVSRTVYIKPSSYSTSEWSDSYPSDGGTVNSKTVCRFESNGRWSEWRDCN